MIARVETCSYKGQEDILHGEKFVRPPSRAVEIPHPESELRALFSVVEDNPGEVECSVLIAGSKKRVSATIFEGADDEVGMAVDPAFSIRFKGSERLSIIKKQKRISREIYIELLSETPTEFILDPSEKVPALR